MQEAADCQNSETIKVLETVSTLQTVRGMTSRVLFPSGCFESVKGCKGTFQYETQIRANCYE
jgi:hypothetical protein